MRRFAFRLTPLLMLREIKEGQAARELRDALGAQHELELELSAAQSIAETARTKLENTKGKSVGAFDFAAALADFDRRLAAERSAGENLLKQAEKVEAARRVWEQAVREVKTVEKLREKAAQAFRKEESRKEQIQLDEVGTRIPVAPLSIHS